MKHLWDHPLFSVVTKGGNREVRIHNFLEYGPPDLSESVIKFFKKDISLHLQELEMRGPKQFHEAAPSDPHYLRHSITNHYGIWLCESLNCLQCSISWIRMRGKLEQIVISGLYIWMKTLRVILSSPCRETRVMLSFPRKS